MVVGDRFEDEEGSEFKITKIKGDNITLVDLDEGISTVFPRDFDEGDFDDWFTNVKDK